MRPEVLLLTGLYDFSADLVSLKLRELGTSCFRLNREQLAQVRISIDPTGGTVRLTCEVGEWELTPELKSVWFRQPVFLRNLPAKPLSPATQLVRSQWMALLHGLTMLDSAMWMNHPRETYQAESKVLQLAIASRIGFDVPRTVVGNDIEAIRSTFPGRFALKPLDTVLLRDGVDELFTYMTAADADEVCAYDLSSAPVIAQELLNDKEDIRVTVIGDQLKAVRIKSKKGAIEGDWRLTPKNDLLYEGVDLPPDVSDRCRRLTAELGLVYAGIDLLATPRGYLFLEANPTGEFSWLISPDRPLDEMIAERLAAGTRLVSTDDA